MFTVIGHASKCFCIWDYMCIFEFPQVCIAVLNVEMLILRYLPSGLKLVREPQCLLRDAILDMLLLDVILQKKSIADKYR